MKKRHSFPIFYFIVFSIFYSVPINAQKKIISTGDEWLYYDGEKMLPSDWYQKNTDEFQWKKGHTPLGYGDKFINTTISYGANTENKHITKYFQKKITIKNPHQYLIYKLSVQRDDGIVIYLNGTELMRNNMPEGEITSNTTAVDLVFTEKKETTVYTKLISPDELLQGINTISASVHQAVKTSSDCLFNIELEGSNEPEMIPLLLKEQTIKNLSLDLKLKELYHKQTLENKDLHTQIVEQSLNSVKTYLYLAVVFLCIAILALIFLWKTNNTKEKTLREKIHTLEESNQNKDREMMNISLNNINNKQFLIEIKKALENIAKSIDINAQNKKKITKVIATIDYNLDYNDDWDNLKKHFNAVHTGYVDRLSKLHPSLTDIELRHCIFIKLHMQTKEIANILHIDPRSVQAARYRLKKKMNLGENTDLKEYLINI